MNRKRELINLAIALQAAGWNAERIGEALGCSGQHIRNILRGQGKPSRELTVVELVVALPAELRQQVETWRTTRARHAQRLIALSKQKPVAV